MSLKRRVEKLESARGGDDEVSLVELVFWSYQTPPYDPELQRRYADFRRRCKGSRLCKLIADARSQRSAG
jgi:hypothetical protein